MLLAGDSLLVVVMVSLSLPRLSVDRITIGRLLVGHMSMVVTLLVEFVEVDG